MAHGYPKIRQSQIEQRRNKNGEMRWFGPSPRDFDGTAQGHGYKTQAAYFRSYTWWRDRAKRKAQEEAAAAEAYTKAELDAAMARNP